MFKQWDSCEKEKTQKTIPVYEFWEYSILVGQWEALHRMSWQWSI
jgi:hypothetical protein